ATEGGEGKRYQQRGRRRRLHHQQADEEQRRRADPHHGRSASTPGRNPLRVEGDDVEEHERDGHDDEVDPHGDVGKYAHRASNSVLVTCSHITFSAQRAASQAAATAAGISHVLLSRAATTLLTPLISRNGN